MENQTQENEETTQDELQTQPSADAQPKKPSKKQQFIQILMFTGFSVSAGVIQFVTTGLLSTWTGLMPEGSGYYWIAYLAGLVLSVVWNFTFNRKFTFKSANNVPRFCAALHLRRGRDMRRLAERRGRWLEPELRNGDYRRHDDYQLSDGIRMGQVCGVQRQSDCKT